MIRPAARSTKPERHQRAPVVWCGMKKSSLPLSVEEIAQFVTAQIYNASGCTVATSEILPASSKPHLAVGGAVRAEVADR